MCNCGTTFECVKNSIFAHLFSQAAALSCMQYSVTTQKIVCSLQQEDLAYGYFSNDTTGWHCWIFAFHEMCTVGFNHFRIHATTIFEKLMLKLYYSWMQTETKKASVCVEFDWQQVIL